jgi:hypothetical protein
MARRIAIVFVSTLLVWVPFQGRVSAHVFTAGTSLRARNIPPREVGRGDRSYSSWGS